MSSIEPKRTLLTLETHLKDIPQAWLHYIEPRIIRPKDTTCWLWTGAVDDRGEPIMSTFKLGGAGRTTVRLKRMVAEMFWSLARHIDVVHECGVTNCLNPGHFYLSRAHWSQENRDKMKTEKQRSIKDYIAAKGRQK